MIRHYKYIDCIKPREKLSSSSTAYTSVQRGWLQGGLERAQVKLSSWTRYAHRIRFRYGDVSAQHKLSVVYICMCYCSRVRWALGNVTNCMKVSANGDVGFFPMKRHPCAVAVARWVMTTYCYFWMKLLSLSSSLLSSSLLASSLLSSLIFSLSLLSSSF